MRYRKKPIIIEAWRYMPELIMCLDSVPEWVIKANNNMCIADGSLPILTINEEVVHAKPGDWIIQESGRNDRAYPCKPDIFEQTYEAL